MVIDAHMRIVMNGVMERSWLPKQKRTGGAVCHGSDSRAALPVPRFLLLTPSPSLSHPLPPPSLRMCMKLLTMQDLSTPEDVC